MWRLWFSFCGRLIAIGVCCCLTLVLPKYWVHNLLHVAIALLALQMTRQFTNNILWLHLHFFLLMMNAIVINRSIDDNDRVMVLIVSMDVFSRLFIWIGSWIQIWFWFFDLTVITVAIVLKSLCSYEVRLSMAARRVCYIFAGYVVTCFEIGVLIFAIPLTAVSAAEMMFVCLISKLWWFTLLFVMAVVFYTSNALLIHQ